MEHCEKNRQVKLGHLLWRRASARNVSYPFFSLPTIPLLKPVPNRTTTPTPTPTRTAPPPPPPPRPPPLPQPHHHHHPHPYPNRTTTPTPTPTAPPPPPPTASAWQRITANTTRESCCYWCAVFNPSTPKFKNLHSPNLPKEKY